MELNVGDRFITHDWGVDEEVEVKHVMLQSIKLERANGEWYYQTPGLVENHMGPKEECEICTAADGGHVRWS